MFHRQQFPVSGVERLRAGQMAAYRHIAENNGLLVPEAAPPAQAAGLVGRDG